MLLVIIIANIVDHEACNLCSVVRPDFYAISNSCYSFLAFSPGMLVLGCYGPSNIIIPLWRDP